MTTMTAKGVSWLVDGRPIVAGIDLEVAPGRVTGIVGPNGSGKTTLLHLLAGLRRPTRGEVLLDGCPIGGLGARERGRRVALVEQKASTDLDLSGREVVALGRYAHTPAWRRRGQGPAIAAALAQADASDLADRRWPTLSGGEQQRLHLARALAQEPDVLLLDEPTNHLDLAHQIAFLERVRALRRTTVLVLHDLDLAAATCDELVVLDAGRVARCGPTAEVLEPALVHDVFAVRTTVRADDRLRVLWHGLAERVEAGAR
jgi:iron complex transport system ATP-binding protein